MTTVIIVQIVALLLLAVSAAESLRARPWWPQSPTRPASKGPARGSSPRERRWIHGGLALVLLANLLSVQMGGTWGVALVLLLVGAAAVVVGFVRGPSDTDLRRYDELHGTDLAGGGGPEEDAGADRPDEDGTS